MTDLIERLHNFEGSDELGNGDFSLLSEAAAEIKTLRAEVDRWKVPLLEWLDKTEWVQQTVKPHELGHHRADVLRHRIEQTEAENERLRRQVEILGRLNKAHSADMANSIESVLRSTAHAERLAEALRGMLDVAAESFANRTYVPINCQQAANAYAALAQEDRNG